MADSDRQHLTTEYHSARPQEVRQQWERGQHSGGQEKSENRAVCEFTLSAEFVVGFSFPLAINMALILAATAAAASRAPRGAAEPSDPDIPSPPL